MAKKIRLTTEQFVQRATETHKNFYLYDKVVYHTSHDYVIITCPLHGVFKQKAYRHLQGGGCSTCGIQKRTKSQQQWITEAIKVHGEKYDYSLVKYEATDKKVIIICPKHGKFEQEAQSHVRGHGCVKCSNDKRGGRGGVYCDSYFSRRSNEQGYFYLALFENKQERFTKIGITKLPFNQRFSSQQQYKITPLLNEKMTLLDAYKREQQIKNENQDLSYMPLKKFSGHTECFEEKIVERLNG